MRMTFKETEEGKEYILVVKGVVKGVHNTCNGCRLKHIAGKLYPVKTSYKGCALRPVKAVYGRPCNGDWNNEADYAFTLPVGWKVAEWIE